MNNELTLRLFNVTLRVASMGSRFILIFALAKMLEPAQLGSFGLMMATISFSTLIIGADYYTYVQRELLARNQSDWSFVIQHQIKGQVLLYSILLPLQILLFLFGFLDWEMARWFFLLLLVEHISQEVNRLLVVMQEQLIASWILFIRIGAWVLVIVPIMFYWPEYRRLEAVYSAWFIGSLCAAMLGMYVIRVKLPNWPKHKTDRRWILAGIRVGGLFLIATICFKGLLTFDKYAVEGFSSTDTLGVYVFYIGVVMGIYNLLEPAIFSFLYPRMLQSYQSENREVFDKIFKELAVSTLLLSIIIAVLLWGGISYLLDWFGKPVYMEYIASFPLLVIAGFMLYISYIPHYALYAMKADVWIVVSHISSLLIFFISLQIVILENAIATVSVALLGAFSWLALIKTVGYFQAKANSSLLKAIL